MHSAPLPGAIVLPVIQELQDDGSVRSAPQLSAPQLPPVEEAPDQAPTTPGGPSSGGAQQPSDPSRRDQRVRVHACMHQDEELSPFAALALAWHLSFSQSHKAGRLPHVTAVIGVTLQDRVVYAGWQRLLLS